jgi:hypothetical protein
LAAPGGRAELHVRVQCPNWIRVDRVQVLFNGLAVRDLGFRRGVHPDRFGTGAIQFDQRVALALGADTHVMVVVGGGGPNLRARGDASDVEQPHVAVSNPVWIDVDGNGFKPHSPVDDKVYTYLDVLEPPMTAPATRPGRVRLYMQNLSEEEARDTLSVEVRPPGAARIAGTQNRLDYRLVPGEQMTWDFDLALEPGFSGSRVNLYIPRSSVGVGRRSVGRNVAVNRAVKAWTHMTEAARRRIWWLPAHVADRPAGWGASRRARRAEAEGAGP